MARGEHAVLVITFIFLRSIKDHLLRHKKLKQYGLISSKSTTENILPLQVTVDCHHEFGHGCSQPTSISRWCIREKEHETEEFSQRSLDWQQAFILVMQWYKIWRWYVYLLSCEFRSEVRMCSYTNAFQHLHRLDTMTRILLIYLLVALNAFSIARKPLGLEVSWNRTQGVCQKNLPNGEDIKGTLRLSYLCCVVQNSGLSDHGVNKHIGYDV